MVLSLMKRSKAAEVLCSRNSPSRLTQRLSFSLSALLAVPLVLRVPTVAAQQDRDRDLKSASALHDHADYPHSIALLQHVLVTAPRSYAANLLLGEDFFESGLFEKAVRPLIAASEIRPDDGVADVYLAHTFSALGDDAKASTALLTALERSRSSVPFLEAWAAFCLDRVQNIGPHLRNTREGEAVALRIEAALRPEGTAEREKLLQQSATEDPEQVGIWGELGTAQLELGLRPAAIESLSQAQQREPTANETLQMQALVAATAGDWAEAERKLTTLAARSPTEFRNALGVWLHVLGPRQPTNLSDWPCLRDASAACPADLMHPRGGDGLGAERLYDEGRWEQLAALSSLPSEPSSRKLWRGIAMAQLGKCLGAIPLLEVGMKVDEQAAGFWLDLCYANQGNLALARLRSSGDNVAVEQLEGDIQLHLHDDAASAEAHYATGLAIDPKSTRLLSRSAEAELRLGKVDDAKRSALAVLALDVNNASAIKTLATIAIEERDYVEALARLQSLAHLEPQDAWTRVEIGVSYAQLGDAERALPYLQQELSAGYPDTKGALHAQLAAVLRKLGKADQAKAASAEASRLANLSFQSVSEETPHAPQ